VSTRLRINDDGKHAEKAQPGRGLRRSRPLSPLAHVEAKAWDDVIAVNVTANWRLIRAMDQLLKYSDAGRVVLISSVSGLYGAPGQINYSASKAGMVGIARSLTRELGSRGITANVVAPGFINTDMTAELPEETQKSYLANVPAGRFAEASEVANVVRWVASDEAAYISGAVIPVDGGLGMGH